VSGPGTGSLQSFSSLAKKGVLIIGRKWLTVMTKRYYVKYNELFISLNTCYYATSYN